MTTTWSQSPYYNALCPGGSVSGCVATAMAQIMKYWNYPAQGSGFHSYNHPNYGTLSANFGGTTYQWSSMPNSVNSSNNAVATLMYHCGVSVDMNYSPNLSGAYVVSSASPVQHCSEYAFKTYFGYESSLQGVERRHYSTSQWVQLLKAELNASRPVLYAGFGTGGGHAFVCDGFNGDYFHMNWGWGGLYDGYFLVDALNPDGTGTGGGTGGYNSGQQAVIGVKPPQVNQTYDMTLYDQVSANPNPVSYGQAFTVHNDIWNSGNTNFSGDFCAAVFDDSYAFLEYIEIKAGYSLPAGNHYTNGLDFSTSGLLTVLPGSYYVGIFYRATGSDWVIVQNGSYNNMVPFNVYYSNEIELYAPLQINIGTNISQYEAFTVSMDVANYGISDFYGVFDVSLYNLDGSFAETIQSFTEMTLSANSHYTNGLQFSTYGVSVQPGTYLYDQSTSLV